MDTKHFKAALIGDFNLGNFAGYLGNDESAPNVETINAPYGQVMQILMNPDHDVWQGKPNFAVIWTRPHGSIASFNRLLNYENVPLDLILDEVDAFAAQVAAARNYVDFIFVPTWVVPSYDSGLGMLDLRDGLGIANTLMRMNL